MFTGLVAGPRNGRRRADSRADGVRLTIVDARWPRELGEGDSVAVNGVCLTATASQRRTRSPPT